MKLLLLLSALFYYANAQGDIVRKCLKKDDSNVICRFSNLVCKQKNVPIFCPNLCGVCDPPTTNVKTTLEKVPCPVQSASRAAKQGHCWVAKFNNGNGESLITFYPFEEQSETGEKKKVGYYGVLDKDDDGSVEALGDIEKGQNTAFFVFETKLTKDKRVVYRAGNSHIPLLPRLYRTFRPEESKQAGTRSVGIKQFIDRAKVQMRGYEFSIRPVVDDRLSKKLGSDATTTLWGLTELATHAFKDPSLEVNIDFKILDTIVYNQNVTPDDAGWRKVTMGANAYDLQKHSDNSTNATTVHIIFSKTPVLEVSDTFSLVYGYKGAICNETVKNIFLIEYFEHAIESISRALSAAVGIGDDYLDGSKVKPDPRYADGKKCTGVGGYMDVKLGANHWTRCSNLDIMKEIQDGTLKCLTKDCYDKVSGCENYDSAQCATNVAKDNCPETCGFCKHYNTTVCQDKQGICGMDSNIVQEHICKKHPGYCPWTCKLCGDSQVTVIPKP